MRKILLILFVGLFTLNISAQSFYDEATIQDISITFVQSNWDALLDAEKASTENYIMAQSVTINGVVFDSVGVKYKGNSTYQANQVKNPFHIELDTYKEQDYQGYKDIKLSNVAKDPSFIREVLSYKVLRNYMDAPLSNYANVTVNGSLIGLYSNSEAISKTFLKDRFDSKSNTFVKCNPPAGAGPTTSDYPNLVNLGTDSALYYAAYELKSDYGWDELLHLCDTLSNHTSDIEKILDVDRALWMLAFNNVLVNLDSYIGGFAQNYYLYRDDNDRFIPIVWDLNESFGTFSSTGSGNLNNTTSKQQMDHLLHSTDANYPLVSKLLSVSSYKKMYLAHVKTMLQDQFTNNGPYYTDGQALQTTISSAVQADPNKFYTFANFTSNITTDITSGGGPGGGASTPGITSLMNGRYSYLMGLSDFTATEPLIASILVSNTTPSVADTVTITATITNETSAVLKYRASSGLPFETVSMFDDGLHNDGAANDNVYGIDLILSSTLTEYYIYAENANIGKFSPTNAEHEFYEIQAGAKALGDLVINEFMASNDVTQADQDGEFDDWVEIYNNTSAAIQLDNYRLSDDISDLDQFIFPVGTVINANSYLVIWADKDLTQTGYHADFKISSSGETLFLADSTLSIIDSVSFGAQLADTSYGRFVNGTGSFQTMPPTYGAQNSLTAAVTSDLVINEFLASNGTTQADQDGEFDDWIELYNRGTVAIVLDSFRLTDDQNDYDQFIFPIGTTIQPNSYLIVWADNDSTQTGLHAGFKLSASGETIFLVDATLSHLDSIAFGNQTSDISYGRFPNGTGAFRNMVPTYNAQNTITSASSGDIVINEFLASNGTVQADQDGEFDDWIELYNKGNTSVDLSTFSLSDDNDDLGLYTFPSGTILEADSFIIVWADGDTLQTGLHANFKLSAGGETLYLSDSLTVVDFVDYTAQTSDTSFGRFPNGTGNFQSMLPTFNASNSGSTGLNNMTLETVEFKLYPNPSNSFITIELNDENSTIQPLLIFDNIGKVVYTNTIKNTERIDVSNWSKGIYFIRIGANSSKLIVN